LASGQGSTMARRRAPAKKQSNDRRRSKLREDLAAFMTEPWEAPAWAKQDTMAASLQRQQLDSFDETLQKNQEVQADLIKSVQDTSEYFSRAEREFSDAILMIRTEREQIIQSLAVSDRWFRGEVAKMKSWIKGMGDRDELYYSNLQTRWEDAFKTYEKQARQTYKDVTGVDMDEDIAKAKNPVKDLAKKYQIKAENEATRLLNKYKAAREDALKQEADLKKTHDDNTADDGQLLKTFGEIESRLDGDAENGVPGLEAGNKNLEDAIKEYSAEPVGDDTTTIKGQLKELKQTQAVAWDKDNTDQGNYYEAKRLRDEKTDELTHANKAENEYNTVKMMKTYGTETGGKAATFMADAKAKADEIGEKTKAVNEDIKAMQTALTEFTENEDGTSAERTGQTAKMGVQLLQKDVDELLGDTGDDPASLKKTTDKLATFSQNLAEFPYIAKDQVREAENDVATKLADENEAMFEMIDKNVKEIKAEKAKQIKVGKHAIDEQVAKTEQKVNDEYDRLVAVKAGDPEKGSIQETLQPYQDQIKNLATQMQTQVSGIASANQKMAQIKASADQQETLLAQQIKTVHDRQQVNLNTAEQDNKRRSTQMIERLENLQEDVETATENGKKAIMTAGVAAEEKIKNSAQEQINKLNARMIDAKRDATTSVNTYNAVKGLQTSLAAFEDRTKALEESIGTASANYNEWASGARTVAEGLPDEATKALHVASTDVEQSIEALKAQGTKEVNGMDAAITKLSKNVKKQAEQMQLQLKNAYDDTVTENTDVTADLRTAVDEVVKDADDTAASVNTAKTTVDAALRTSEDASDAAYTEAQETLARYTATFKGSGADASAAPDPTSQLGQFQTRAVDTVEAVRDKATSLTDQADAEILKAAKAAATKVKKAEDKMKNKVAAMTNDLASKAVDVDARKQQLNDLGLQAQAVRDKADKTAAGMKDFEGDVNSAKDAINDAAAAGKEAINEGAAQVGDYVAHEGEALKEGSDEALKDAERDVDESERKTKADLKKVDAAEDEQERSFAEKAEAETANAAEEMTQLGTQTRTAAQMEQRRNAAMDAAFANIAAQAAHQKDQFTEALQESKEALRGLTNGTEMDTLLELISTLESTTHEKVEDITDKDTARIDRLKGTAKRTHDNIVKKTGDTRDSVKDFEGELDDLEDKARKALKEASNMEAGFQDDMSTKQKAFTDLIMSAKKERVKETQDYQHEVDTSVNSIDATQDLLKTLATKITGQISYELGTMQLKQAKLDKDLGHTLSLEKYGDEGAIEALSKKLAEANLNEDELDKLKQHLQDKSDAFQKKILKDFETLGIEFKMEDIEKAQAQAQENYYIQQQHDRLHNLLGDAVDGLRGEQAARLRALAAASGAKIAALMKDENLSEAERAAALAKIREDARNHANQILQANNQLQLEQETAARQLAVVTDEVGNSMERISALGSASAGTTGAAGLQGTLNRIKNLLEQANQNIGDAPLPKDVQDAKELEKKEDKEDEDEAAGALAQMGEPQPAAGMMHGVLNSIMSAFNPAVHRARSLLETHGGSSAKLSLKPADAVPIVMEAERGSAKALAEDDRLGARLDALERKLITN